MTTALIANGQQPQIKKADSKYDSKYTIAVYVNEMLNSYELVCNKILENVK